MNPLTNVYVLLGSNVAPAMLVKALERLRAVCNVRATSSLYRSPAAGRAAGGPDYYNAAAHCLSDSSPVRFKEQLRAIEAALGRRRDKIEVAIDLDIVLWGETPIEYGSKPWRSPSPDLLRYAFVAVPVAEIAPDLIHPETGQTMAEIAGSFAAAPLERLGTLPPTP
ncbi:MAG: 2-amino-4-hydroxy-6-hydroxymethyldihydropteridine diphosphokinase [Chloroflexota bacterium]